MASQVLAELSTVSHGSTCVIFHSSPGERHGSCIAIHSDMLTSMKPLSGDTCAKNGWDMIFAGHNRTMAEWATHISNYPCGQGEEWRPGGRCDSGHQDSSLSHQCELIRAGNDPGLAGDMPGAGRESFQHILRWLIGTSGHHTAEVHA